MNEHDENSLRMELARLRQDHRDLDTAVCALMAGGDFDHLELQRLKKRKLVLKDRIECLENQFFPDIIA